MTRKTRGLTRSVIALIMPPFPAASRPSKTIMTFFPSFFDPCLQMTKLDLKLVKGFFVVLSLHLAWSRFMI